MIYFLAALHSKHTFARFRSSLENERLAAAPPSDADSTHLRWADAWQRLAQRHALGDPAYVIDEMLRRR